MPYVQYLETPEWAEARTAALERADHRCALDVSHTDGLEVQHRTKERLGAELEGDLVVLCASCLELYQDDSRRMRRTGSIPPPVPQSVPAPVTPITAAAERKFPICGQTGTLSCWKFLHGSTTYSDVNVAGGLRNVFGNTLCPRHRTAQ